MRCHAVWGLEEERCCRGERRRRRARRRVASSGRGSCCCCCCGGGGGGGRRRRRLLLLVDGKGRSRGGAAPAPLSSCRCRRRRRRCRFCTSSSSTSASCCRRIGSLSSSPSRGQRQRAVSPRDPADGAVAAPTEAAAILGIVVAVVVVVAATFQRRRSRSPPVPRVPEQQSTVTTPAREHEAVRRGGIRAPGGDGLDAARVPPEDADPPRVGGVPQGNRLVARGRQQPRVALRPGGVEDGVLVAEPLRSREGRARGSSVIVFGVLFVLVLVFFTVMERRRQGHPSVHYRDAPFLVGDGKEAAVVVHLGGRERCVRW